MLPQHILLALAATVTALPLNINMGAYSPAMVVGDGEISIGEAGSASELMATLASGTATAKPGGSEGQKPAEGQTGKPAEGQKAADGAKPEGGDQGKPAEGAAGKRKRFLRRTINDFLTRRTPAPAPAPEPAATDKLAAVEGAMQWIKRDLAGFNAALNYAREAMKNQPKVQLGTEEAGVGILVSPGVNVATNSGANGARPEGEKPKQEPKAKRDEVVEESDSPKLTLISITEV